MTEQERESLWKMIDELAAKLAEHFDCVQILSSSCDEEGSRLFFAGAGNWYARQGMAQEFIKADEAETLARKINQ